MGVELTTSDTFWMAIGSIAETAISLGINKTATFPDTSSAQYPSLASAAFIAGPAVAIAYSGLNNPETSVDRKLAAFSLGFEVSGIVSYAVRTLVGKV